MRAAVVVNPVKAPPEDARRVQLESALVAAGWKPPLWLETTADDPGYGMAEEALARHADLVLTLGGDGTVRAVLTVVAGSGVPMGVLPVGTGNLLARNLGIPLGDLSAALETALDGTDRAIDVGRIEPDGPPDRAERFAIMAGMGLDAAIMGGAPDAVKDKVGWPAYVLSAARQLGSHRIRVEVAVDSAEPLRTRAQTVLVGNVGQLQGGLELMPDAVPDDGLLDIAVVAARGPADWIRVVTRVVGRRRIRDRRFRTLRGRTIRITAQHRHPREADGDVLRPGRSMVVQVEPGAIIVRVPATAGPSEEPPR